MAKECGPVALQILGELSLGPILPTGQVHNGVIVGFHHKLSFRAKCLLPLEGGAHLDK
jgi:hypothetical protein